MKTDKEPALMTIIDNVDTFRGISTQKIEKRVLLPNLSLCCVM